MALPTLRIIGFILGIFLITLAVSMVIPMFTLLAFERTDDLQAFIWASLITFGSGFALEPEAPGLAPLHRRLADAFAPWLTPQDRQPFRPHVTLMNKADRLAARLGLSCFRDEFEPWSATGTSLRLWAYQGGPWEPLARYPLSGSPPSPPED